VRGFIRQGRGSAFVSFRGAPSPFRRPSRGSAPP
jgi:hypothetical protein